MTQLSYKKIVEVVIRNDYFHTGEVNPDNWPDTYTLGNELEIWPSPECEKLLKDYRVRFRTTHTGFQLIIQSDTNKTFVRVALATKWTFYVRLKNPQWVNFTNNRLTDSTKTLFYFSNRQGTALVTDTVPAVTRLYLGNALPTYGTAYPNETTYLIGDLVRRAVDDQIFQAIENGIDPTSAFDPAVWYDTGFSTVQYVNPQDYIPLQYPAFLYERPNTDPNESIGFSLKDIDNQPVELGTIATTGLPQKNYKAPALAQDPVHHTLSLGHLSPGIYTLSISSSQAFPDYRFYYLNPLRDRNVDGIIELFASNATAGFNLFDVATEPGKTLIQERTFQIRFRNRLTQWQYLRQDNTEEELTAYRPLRKRFSGGTTNPPNIPKPDPDASVIYPTRTGNQISAVISKIFLNR